MRTKDEIADILAKRGINDELQASTWSDLVTAIQSYTQDQKDKLVAAILNNKPTAVGEALHQALLDGAEIRSRQNVDVMLANDSLSLEEIDKLI